LCVSACCAERTVDSSALDDDMLPWSFDDVDDDDDRSAL
jgi:hypothetical protein